MTLSGISFAVHVFLLKLVLHDSRSLSKKSHRLLVLIGSDFSTIQDLLLVVPGQSIYQYFERRLCVFACNSLV